ncbi:MAG: MmgE/PrpD family protein [Myxococcota bacterium]|nr:MmgE/PrpD family protein [Myxococcota bacterium]
MSTIIQRLGRFSADFIPEQLPPSVLQRVRLQHVNLAGAVRAVSGHPLAAALAGSGPAASVRRNAALGSWLEQDDVLFGGQTGAGAVPVAWALSEGHSIEALLTAVAMANEIAGRIGAATILGPGLGMSRPMVTAAAAAVAAARMLSLSAEQTSHAISLSLTSCGLPAVPRGVPADALRLGSAARSGLEAAFLARDGVRGDLGLLDDPAGPLSQQCWLPLRAAFTGLGQAWLSETLAFKLDPLALHAQVPVQGVREILNRHIKAADKRLRVDQVERIEISTTALSAAMARRHWPLRPSTVPHSIRHAVGVLVVNNELSTEHLTEGWLAENREQIGAVAGRVSVTQDAGRSVQWMTSLVEVATPLFAGITLDELKQVMQKARSQYGMASMKTRSGMLAWAKARPDRLYDRIRYSTGDLSTARLEELQFRCDTEVKLFTTRGGSWPERRSLPEGSPGWSWDDTVQRTLKRHGAPDVAGLLSAPASGNGSQWVASILASTA